MRSILGIFSHNPSDDLLPLRREALDRLQRQRLRGPDWGGLYVDRNVMLVHERLAIVDPQGVAQPSTVR